MQYCEIFHYLQTKFHQFQLLWENLHFSWISTIKKSTLIFKSIPFLFPSIRHELVVRVCVTNTDWLSKCPFPDSLWCHKQTKCGHMTYAFFKTLVSLTRSPLSFLCVCVCVFTTTRVNFFNGWTPNRDIHLTLLKQDAPVPSKHRIIHTSSQWVLRFCSLWKLLFIFFARVPKCMSVIPVKTMCEYKFFFSFLTSTMYSTVLLPSTWGVVSVYREVGAKLDYPLFLPRPISLVISIVRDPNLRYITTP